MSTLVTASTPLVRRLLVSGSALLAMLAGPRAFAQGPPCFPCTAACAQGVSLRWDACYLDGAGVANKTFACNTNSGSEKLVGSFVLLEDAPQIAGALGTLTITSSAPALPAWWQLRNQGACRPLSLALLAQDPDLAGSACPTWAGTALPATGIASWTNQSANRVKVELALAVQNADASNLSAGVEYSVFSLRIDHAKTVGTGACSGCDVPICIAFAGLEIAPVGATTWDVIRMLGPAHGTNSDLVTWQSGIVTAYTPGHVPFETCQFFRGFDPYEFSCADAATPTRTQTWGAVKSLYR